MSELVRRHDRKEVLHEMKYSPDAQFLAVGSNDNFVDIYDVHGNYRKVRLHVPLRFLVGCC